MQITHRQHPATVISLLSLLCVLAPASAEDAKSVFDSLFASKIRTVSATADRADDVALAKEMLAMAKTSANQPDLVALLCDAAHDLGARHADGYAIGVESMLFLADTVEGRRPAAREKAIALLTKQSTAGKPDEREAAGEAMIDLLLTLGDDKVEKKQYAEAGADYRRAVTVATQKKSTSLDEAKAKMEFALSRERTVKQLARLQEKLLRDADSATAEEIVKLYVIELDDPEAAKPYLNRVKDEQLKMLTPLAARPADQLGETYALKLGEWYFAAAQASTSNAPAYRRAESYLTRYVALHTERDLSVTKAEAQLKEAREKLKAVSAKKLPRGTVLGEDGHDGFTGNATRANVYTLKADEEFDLNRTMLKFRGWGHESPDTNGDIFLRVGDGPWTKVGAWTKASCTKALATDNWQDLSLAGVPGTPAKVKTKQIEVRFQYTSGIHQLDIDMVRWVVR